VSKVKLSFGAITHPERGGNTELRTKLGAFAAPELHVG
jgi:hypothetical protein